jgi:polyisoprenoid-binding protein YceI
MINTNPTNPATLATTKWLIDPTHSEIGFKVKHLMITTVTGYFSKFSLEVETEEEDFTKASRIVFSAQIDSINTSNEQRDTHLKSPDFFDANNYSHIEFVGRKYEKASTDYRLHGDLTIRTITRPVTLKVDFGGIVKDPYGQTKAGFTVEGKISRKEFGLTWNAVTEAGSVVVSDEIKIHCEVQLVKQS